MTLKYTPEHEWIELNGDVATVGITHYAQDALGDVVYVEMPEVGTTFAPKDAVAVVESVKAASDVYMPAHGVVVKVNEDLRANPSLANTDPMGSGWFFKVKLDRPSDLDALLDEAQYHAHLGKGSSS